METQILINIGVYTALTIICSAGAMIILGAWYASHRLTRVETKVENFENRITSFDGRLDNAFASKSPIALLPKGQTILVESGLKKYIDDHKDILLSNCGSTNKMTNQYDIQESVFRFFDQLNFGDFDSKIKEASFTYGVSIETIRRIGAIYFRDIALVSTGFKPEDLDKPKV